MSTSCLPAPADDVARIDFAIRLNYMLVSDGRHPAVDYAAVWGKINELLDARIALTKACT